MSSINVPVVKSDDILLDINQVSEVTSLQLTDYLVLYRQGSPGGHKKISVANFIGTLPVIPVGVVFGGTTDFLLRTTGLGASDNSTFLFSCWIYKEAADEATIYLSSDSGGSSNQNLRTQVFFNTNGTIGARLWDGASSPSIVTSVTSVGAMIDDQWNHVLVARNAGTYQIYINDSDATGATGQNTGTNHHNVNYHILPGVFSNPGNQAAEIGEYYFTNEYLDISNVNNRAKFISGGAPVDLGADGSTPTGTAPLIYFTGDATVWNFGANSGSGGNFTITGSVTNSSNNPISQ